SPKEVVKAAKHLGCRSISYTYTEPTIFFEYAYETAKLAHEEGIKNVFVTNGYITKEALETVAPYLDAANIDLKGLSEELYLKNCGGHLNPVLDAIRLYKALGVWVEVTTLIIPTLNDKASNFRKIPGFIKTVGVDIPWHISRFYPTYKLVHLNQTPIATLHEARKIGLEVGLRYVYEGNVPGNEGENTYCYNCGRKLIQRYAYLIHEHNIKDSMCPYCGVKIDGLGI
ncbi:MAG: AmmeMemoRadiSam system radical SAM enzyme, partial [Candidatus Bathyarchaeota archaeon]